MIVARDGQRAAFAALYERFHRVVHAIALARVAACDAGDVVQDVFTDAWHKLPRLREPAAFPGWLLAIARHRAIDAARRRPTLDTAADLAVEPPPRLEAAAALRAIRALPDTYRETLIPTRSSAGARPWSIAGCAPVASRSRSPEAAGRSTLRAVSSAAPRTR